MELCRVKNESIYLFSRVPPLQPLQLAFLLLWTGYLLTFGNTVKHFTLVGMRTVDRQPLCPRMQEFMVFTDYTMAIGSV